MAELLLQVPSRQRRWLSSSSLRRLQLVQPRSHNRQKQSAGWRWWRSCWQKTIWASLPPPHTAWNIQISLRKVWKKKNLHSAAKESNKKDNLFHLERCLVSRTLTQPVKILLLYSEKANRSGEIGHDKHCIKSCLVVSKFWWQLKKGESRLPPDIIFVKNSHIMAHYSLYTRSPPQARAIKLRIALVLVDWSHAGGGETNIDLGQYWSLAAWLACIPHGEHTRSYTQFQGLQTSNHLPLL